MQIITKTFIKAPVENTWKQLTNFKSYPEWNLFITKIEGEQSLGKRLIVEISPEGGRKTIFKPVLTRYVPNQEMRWVGVLGAKWLFSGEHYFQLEDNGDGTTNFTHGENFTGLLVPLLKSVLKKTEIGFNKMNHNLKSIMETMN